MFLLLAVRWFGRGVGVPVLLFVILLLAMNIGQPQAGECVINHIAGFFVFRADFQHSSTKTGFAPIVDASDGTPKTPKQTSSSNVPGDPTSEAVFLVFLALRIYQV